MSDQVQGSLPGPEVTDWHGPAGATRVDGVSYHLPTMENWELTELHARLASQAKDIKAQLASNDVERLLAGSLLHDALIWRNKARHALGLKKKQMDAIHAEFSRRKAQMPPLGPYYAKAVRQLFGEVGLGRVQARVRELVEAERGASVPNNDIRGDKYKPPLKFV